MLRPSYAELMNTLNKNSDEDVTSRYTVVIAAAKRARQIIDGDEPMADEAVDSNKPVSIAVEEIKEGKIAVVPEGEGTKLKPRKTNDEAEIKKELEEKAVENANINENIDDAEDLDNPDDLDDLDDIESLDDLEELDGIEDYSEEDE